MINYVYVAAQAKEGTNKGVVRIPVNKISNYDILHSTFKMGTPEYNELINFVADEINTTPENTDILERVEVGSSQYTPSWYSYYVKTWYPWRKTEIRDDDGFRKKKSSKAKPKRKVLKKKICKCKK